MIKIRRRLGVPIAPQHVLQFLHLWVRLARAVPQIIVSHGATLLTHFGHSLYLPWRSVPSRSLLYPPVFRAASASRGEDSRAPTHASPPCARQSPARSSLPQAET